MKHGWKTDLLAGGLAGILLVVSLVLLWRDTDAADGVNPRVGFITYRFRVAQRRGSTSVVWRDLDLNSPVFNNNYVRTDAASEAIITLDDKTRIELEPDSMIVLQVRDTGTNIKLEKGSLLIKRNHTGRDRVPLTVTPGENQDIKLKAGSADVRVERAGPGFRAAPRRGDIKLGTPGKNTSGGPGSILTTDGRGVRVERDVPRPQAPADNLRLFIDGEKSPVDFAWKPNGPIVLEISSSPRMTPPALKRTTLLGTARVNLPPGFHYWRIRVMNTGRVSSTRKIRIIKKPRLLAISPGDGQVFSYTSRPPLIGFSWSPNRLAIAYTVRVARDRAMRDAITEIRAYRVGASRKFPAGVYYWRLETEGVLPGSSSKSAVRRFIVRKSRSLSRPRLIYPAAKSILLAGKKEGILFRWRATPELDQARLEIMRNTPDGKPILSVAVRDNHHRLKEQLVPGKYFWRVRIQSRDGKSSSYAIPFRMASSIVKKKVQSKPKIVRPFALFPRNGSTMDMTTRDSINFKWVPVPGAIAYDFKLYFRGRIIYRAGTRRPHLRFTDLSKLDTGRFKWRITAIMPKTSPRRFSRARASFRITLSDGPDKPTFKKP